MSEVNYGNYLVHLTQESLNGKSELSPEFICTACMGIVRPPVQTLCGHRYCKTCLEKIIEDDRKCKAEECRDETELEFEYQSGKKIYYYPDNFVKKNVEKLRVHCPNRAKGCKWIGRLNDIETHVEKECKSTLKQCPHCLEPIPAAEESTHPLVCTKAVTTTTCVLAGVGCPVTEEMSVQELNRHNLKYHTVHLKLMMQHIPSHATTDFKLTLPPDDLMVSSVSDGVKELKISDRQQVAPIQSSKQTGYVNEIEGIDMVSTVRRLDSQNRLQEERLTEQSKIIQQLEKKLLDLTDALEKVEKKQDDHGFRLMLEESSTFVGETIWRIPNFRQRQEDAKKNKFASIYSLPFYTSRYGYKMCLRLYPYGDGSGRGSHLSLFLVVMRGEYDDILEWPYKHKVTFQLLNTQSDKDDITDAFRADPDSSSFKKPVSDMNVATGCPKFAPLDVLFSQGFVANDTIYIRAKVDPFNGSKLGPF